MQALGCVYARLGFGCVFQVDGDEDEPEVGEEGLVDPVVAGGGLAVALHAVEDAFDHVPPLVRIPCLCSMVLRPVERLVFSPKER